MPIEINRQDLARSIAGEVGRMRDFAHMPEHFLDPGLNESPGTKYPDDLVFREKVVGWESKVTYAYSVDLIKDETGVVRRKRHLSVQISVPGAVRQGEINAATPTLLALYEPVARLFFPLHERIGFKVLASDPIPVVNPETRQVTQRTVVTAHIVVDHDDTDGIFGSKGMPDTIEPTGLVRDRRNR